jgi:flavodoxin
MQRRDIFKVGLAGIGTIVLSNPVSAIENFLKASAKKTWVIVYGSQCGSTRDAANWINEGLGGIADVVDIATKTPNVGDYENFIIGGWISGGNLMPASIKTYITSNKAALAPKIMGLFTLCGNQGKPVGDTQIKNYLTNNIVAFSGVTDKPAKLFNGRSTPSCGGGNYDLLKKEDCVAFGQKILPSTIKTIQQDNQQHFELCQNSPNPFNHVTTIKYRLPRTTNVVLSICALNGQRMITLVSGLQTAGNHEVTWDGSKLAPGYYLYQLEAGGIRATRTARRIGR